MTGAPIPVGCDAVVKQENVERFDGRIVLSDTIRLGSNIRRMGEDVGAGDPLVGEGTILDTRHVALLAACGVDKVQSVRRVRIAIAAFGNEIREPGADLRRGQIFDANSAMAAAFLQRPYTQLQQCVRSGDNRDRAVELLRDLSADADLIVTSGGMASGDEDHTRRALEEAGGSWQRIALRMRPGKPAGLGRLGNAVLLGLPGNPFAALVALLILGVPILDALTGSRRTMRWSTAAYSTEFPESPAARTEFFPARIIAQSHSGSPIIERLGKGGSARLRPLVDADGLGRSSGGVTDRLRGRSVEFLSFAELLAH
jgi:molybdopterin molybdotransferase